MGEININESERKCRKCDTIKPIDDFLKCNKSFQGRKSYCKKCGYEYKKQRKISHPVECKIHQMADNIHKRLVTSIDKPANTSYKEKGIISKIGNSGAEIYRYLYKHFYEDIKHLIEQGEVPSIDRIDSEKHYEHGNLRIITFAENSKMGREKSKEKCQRAVKITWRDGKIEVIESVKKTAEHLNISSHSLQKILKGKTKQKKDFFVEYLEPPKVKPRNYYKKEQLKK